MRRFWNEIDLHVVALLMTAAPWVCLGWWWLTVPLLLSQGLICVRTFELQPPCGPRWTYLGTNELVVFMAMGAFVGLRFTVGLLSGRVPS